MNTKKFVKLFALITIFALLFAACGSKEEAPAVTEAPVVTEAPAAPQAPAAVELGLTDWTLDASIWSSVNGASIDLTATPKAYAEGMTASFVVRLEGEDITNNPCEWNGTAFTSYADLNAEDGYCYYVVLTGPDGAAETVEINTPTTPTNEALINLAASLESFCHATVADSSYENETLTIAEGSVVIQIPRVSGSSELTCTAAELILNLDGGALTKESLNDKLTEADNDAGIYTADLAGIQFNVPTMEGDHHLALTLVAHLSDGSTLTDDSSAAWFYSDSTVHLTVG